jgi:hypothetical protein
LGKRRPSSTELRNARATIGPTPGTVIRRRQVSSRRSIEMNSVSSSSILATTGSRVCRSASVAAASAGRPAQLVRTRTAGVRRSPRGNDSVSPGVHPRANLSVARSRPRIRIKRTRASGRTEQYR